MSLVINHNSMAANTARNLNTHYGNLATSTQRLSSGLRINGAADDAAGLAIRELMRADIAAYNQGIRNANDAISMIQVVDGALGIIDEKLIRMKELAEQAATGTYDSTQRLMIDSEFQAMASEIQRIATATDFNGIKLIDGQRSKNIELNIPTTETVDNTVTKSRDYFDPVFRASQGGTNYYLDHEIVNEEVTIQTKGTQEIEYLEIDGEIQKKTTNNLTVTTTTTQNLSSIGSYSGTYIPNLPAGRDDSELYEILNLDVLESLPNPPTTTSQRFSATKDMVMDFSYSFANDNVLGEIAEGWTFPTDKHNRYRFEFDINGDNKSDIAYNLLLKDYIDPDVIQNSFQEFGFSYSAYPITFTKTETKINTEVSFEKLSRLDIGDAIKIHFGPMNDPAEDYYYIDKRDCTLKGLGLEDVRIETQDKAQEALVTINDAIVKKDQARAYYGAMQNRLENTVSNLTIQAENLQASESRISDVDVATEMTNFVRNQILTQSAVAMLSQANSMPQMAMQLIGS